MFSQNYSNLRELHDGLTRRVALATKDKVDYTNSVDVQLHDVMVSADEAVMDFDLKEAWLTKGRWSMLIRQYIDPDALAAWLDLIELKMKGGRRGQAFMRTKAVKPRGRSRQWGSCIIGFGFRAAPTPKLIMHSRTSYMGYIAFLDLSIAHVLAKMIGERLGVESMGFIWHLDSAQFHYARCLGWWFTQGKPYMDLPEHKAIHRPGLYGSIKLLNKYKQEDREEKMYGDATYSSALRPRKRWHSEVLGMEYALKFEGGTKGLKTARKAYKPLPSVHVDTLDFTPLYRKNEEGDILNADYMGECCEAGGLYMGTGEDSHEATGD